MQEVGFVTSAVIEYISNVLVIDFSTSFFLQFHY